jgi:hypothetical protein
MKGFTYSSNISSKSCAMEVWTYVYGMPIPLPHSSRPYPIPLLQMSPAQYPVLSLAPQARTEAEAAIFLLYS